MQLKTEHVEVARAVETVALEQGTKTSDKVLPRSQAASHDFGASGELADADVPLANVAMLA